MRRSLVFVVIFLAAVSACVGSGSNSSAVAPSETPSARAPVAPSASAPDVVAVPLVMGTEQAEARRRIEAVGLRPLVVGGDGSVGAGVLQQSPPAGWLLRPGKIVRIALAVDGRSIPAAGVRAALDVGTSTLGQDWFVLAVEPAGTPETKRPSCGQASCALVRLSDGHRGAGAVVQLQPTVALLDLGRQNQPDGPPGLMSYAEIVAAAASVPAVQARLGGRAFTSATAGGPRDEPWCVGQPRFPGTFCTIVMLFINGESGRPLLVPVNWITGAAGLTDMGQ